MGILKQLSKRICEIQASRSLPEALYPVPEDLIESFNVSYEGRDGNTLKADIYRPKETEETENRPLSPSTESRKLPIIILIHGGGLFAGLPVMERPACEELARKGYLVIAPSYRMLTDAEICGEIADICAAYDFAYEMHEDYGGDPDRIFVVAESAGAYLAAYAAAMTKSDELCGVIGYGPPKADIKAIAFVSGMFYMTRRDLIGIAYPGEAFGDRKRDKAFRAYMDPEHHEVISNLPPAVLTSSRNDFLRKYTIRYSEALKTNGNDCKLIYYAENNKKLIHAFVTLYTELPESRDGLEKINIWFREHGNM